MGREMQKGRKAIIIGASSGIGRELAKILAARGYRLGLAARREDLLTQLQEELPVGASIRTVDIRDARHVRETLEGLIQEVGGLDLAVISAGTGHLNPALELEKELDTIATNVHGFTVAANALFRHFYSQGHGHLVGISSIAAIRGGAAAPAYHASKAFVSNYLEGLTVRAAKSGLPILVTEVQPGFVDTAMAMGEGMFWVATAPKAAAQICAAIEKRRPHAFITRRWRLIAWLLRLLPAAVYRRM